MSFNRKEQRNRRHMRLRQRVKGTAARPRMAICISNKHMYVQFIDDVAMRTLAATSTLKEAKPCNLETAKRVGEQAANVAKEKGISIVVVVGDREGRVGFGFGKANEVSDAIRKGGDAAKKEMMRVKLAGKTIPHEVTGMCDGGRVLLKPAPDGTGLIVGGGMRPVLEAAGVRDAIGKSLGSKNRLNVVKATVDALNNLRSAEEIAAARA